MAGWNRVEKARSRIAGVLTRIIKVISDQSQGDGKKPTKLPWSGSVNSIVNRLRSKIMAFFFTHRPLLVNGLLLSRHFEASMRVLQGIISVRGAAKWAYTHD